MPRNNGKERRAKRQREAAERKAISDRAMANWLASITPNDTANRVR